MRSIIEQVDEFIENYYDGSITAILAQDYNHNSIEQILKNSAISADSFNDILKMLKQLSSNLIPFYLQTNNDEEKSSLALQIFNLVITLREFGALKNNPTKITELNWYKSEYTRLKEENKDLRQNVKDLTNTVLNMSTPKDAKIGVK